MYFPPSSSSLSSLSALILLLTSVEQTNAGVFFGGSTASSDGCYGALQSSTRPDENVVDKDGYVLFINKLSNNTFTSFQYNEQTGEWGQYPVTTFNELPVTIKEQFYTHACGGPYVICENAYLYTDGMNGVGSTVLDPQQVVYLFEVCKGVEEAIEEASISATSIAPTPSSPLPASTAMPTTISSSQPSTEDGTFTAEIPLQLTYQAAVSEFIIVEELQMTNSTTRAQLLDAMTTWSMTTARRFGFGVDNQTSFTRLSKGQRRSHRRRLLVYPEPLVEVNGTTLMSVMEVECRDEMNVTIEATDHCIEVTTDLSIQFVDELIGSEIDTLHLLEEEFENDIQDGTFLAFISPPSTKQEFRAIYPPVTMSELFEPGGGGNPSPPTTPESEMLPPVVNSDTLDKLIQDHDNATKNPPERGNSSTAGIVSAVCIGLVLVGVAFFVVRRRRALNESYKGISGFEKKDLGPTYDLEGGIGQEGDSKHSSRDEFSSGESNDSSSMQSYSESERSGQSSESDSDSSQSDDSSASSRSSEYDDRVNPYQKNDPNVAYDVEGGGRNASRSTAHRKRSSNGSMSSSSKSAGGSRAADDDSSAGSSGWDSSDGNSSVDTSTAESYTGDLSSSHSGRSDDNSATYPNQLPSMSNQVDNLLTQRSVTMIPIDEGSQEDIELTMISYESASIGTSAREREYYPSEGDIQDAIEKGDWAAVGATAAILASSDSTGIEVDDDATKDFLNESHLGTMLISSHTDEDDARAAELAELVESGNWDGVVAVAARYADEADEADEQLEEPPLHNYARKGSSPSSKGYGSGNSIDSSSSVMDASVETEDASSTGAGASQDSTSRNSNLDDASLDGTAERDTDELSLPVTTTPGSSSASSSSASQVSQQEKQQANAYRIEVETLVRRVVPDEIDNIDDIMEQFSGREEELIETLRVMQEKSIAQRARAAVQRSAKREAGRASRDTAHDDDEEMDHSVGTDYSYTTGSKSTDGVSTYSREDSSTEYSTNVTDID